MKEKSASLLVDKRKDFAAVVVGYTEDNYLLESEHCVR